MSSTPRILSPKNAPISCIPDFAGNGDYYYAEIAPCCNPDDDSPFQNYSNWKPLPAPPSSHRKLISPLLLDLALIFLPYFFVFTLTCPIQVTLGEEGSGFSNALPRFFLIEGNIGEAWPPLMLPLLQSRRLREKEREEGSPFRPGLRIDFEDIFMEDEESRDVKQMKSSLMALFPPLVVQ